MKWGTSSSGKFDNTLFVERMEKEGVKFMQDELKLRLTRSVNHLICAALIQGVFLQLFAQIELKRLIELIKTESSKFLVELITKENRSWR